MSFWKFIAEKNKVKKQNFVQIQLELPKPVIDSPKSEEKESGQIIISLFN